MGLSAAEGMAFDSVGNLYVVNIPYGQILRVSPDGDFSVVTRPTGDSEQVWRTGVA